MSRSLHPLIALIVALAAAPGAHADEPGTGTPATEQPAADQPNVVLYMTSWCHYCRLTSTYLRNKGVTFTERNIEDDRQALTDYFSAGGGGGVPMVVIGETAIMGYDTAAMDRALAAQPPPDAPPAPEEPTPNPKTPPDGKWPKRVQGETIDIGGDVHEPEVTFIVTRQDVLEEVEMQLSHDPLAGIAPAKPEQVEEEEEED